MKIVLLIISLTIILTIWVVYIYLSKEEKKYNFKNKNDSKEEKNKLDILIKNDENSLKSIIENTNYSDNELIIPIGIDENNKIEKINLNENKSILIIGTTGGGKSICLNEIIASSIIKYDNTVLKYLTIDTSLVELSSFNGIPHYIKDTISNPMEIIYELEKIIQAIETKKNKENIVIVIDDYYDIFSIDNARVKSIINKLLELTQKTNVNLIVATDTPSKEYIDFEKFDTKMYLTLSPGEDAYFEFDNLTNEEKEYIDKIGNMIYVNKNNRIKVQATLVTDEEINNICEFYKKNKITML